MTYAYGFQTRSYILGHMSIVFRKFINFLQRLEKEEKRRNERRAENRALKSS